MKRVIQTYKPAGQWRATPPGIGDFLRGTCHLFEHLQNSPVELRVDVSQTGFADLIVRDDAFFHAGDRRRIAGAPEHFEDDAQLLRDLAAFRASSATDLYVCSNMGAWNRLRLPPATREFARKFYRFTDAVERTVAGALPGADYAVLSVRCGDQVFGDPSATLPVEVMRTVTATIARHILPHTRWPLVVTSDSLALKRALAERYHLSWLPHAPGHGARGDEFAVALDLCALKGAREIYHINAWADWWSGFSHYTSMIFEIPSVNFRAPRFAKEAITADGTLRRPSWWRRLSGR